MLGKSRAKISDEDRQKTNNSAVEGSVGNGVFIAETPLLVNAQAARYTSYRVEDVWLH